MSDALFAAMAIHALGGWGFMLLWRDRALKAEAKLREMGTK